MKTIIGILGVCFIIIIVGISCKKEYFPVNIDTTLNLWIRNKAGKNLLDSTTIGYYKTSDIKVFKLVDGKKIEVYDANWDAPHHYIIGKNEGNGEYFMKLFPYEGIGDPNERGTRQEITTTYIQWQPNNVDTLVCTMTRIDASLFCDKVLYNGALKYDVNTRFDVTWGNGIFRRFMEITK